MAKYLAQYDVDGIRYESFVGEARLSELKQSGQFVWSRRLTQAEIYEIMMYRIV